MKEQKIVNGVSYAVDTPDRIISILETAYQQHTRLVLDYGDTETGKSWEEQYDITGYIGRSTGTVPIPLLVYNSRSYGGGGILTDCIVAIRASKGKGLMYSHPNYSTTKNYL